MAVKNRYSDSLQIRRTWVQTWWGQIFSFIHTCPNQIWNLSSLLYKRERLLFGE